MSIFNKDDWKGVIRGNVLMMGLVSLFTDASSEMIYPLLPVFISGLVPVKLAAIYVGAMEGIAESTASIMKIIAGSWSDRLGKRKILAVAGYGISTIARPLMAISMLGWHVIGLRFLDRIGKGIRTSPRDALISDSITPDARGRAFSFHRAMDHLGAVTGSLLSVLILYAFLGYALWKGSTEAASSQEMNALRWVFGISLIPGIFAVLTLSAKVREIPPQKTAKADIRDGSGIGGRHGIERAGIPRIFYYYLGIVVLFTLGNSSDLFLLFYGKELFGLGLLQVIAAWILLHISKIIFSFPGGYLSDKVGRRPMMIAGWIVYVAVYIGMAFLSSQWVYWILIFIYGAYYGFTEGTEKALVADYVGSESRGTAYGYFHGAVGIAALPASLLFGVFWAALGPVKAFSIGAGLAGLATVLMGMLLASGRSGKSK
jgi:MFS family permease